MIRRASRKSSQGPVRPAHKTTGIGISRQFPKWNTLKTAKKGVKRRIFRHCAALNCVVDSAQLWRTRARITTKTEYQMRSAFYSFRLNLLILPTERQNHVPLRSQK